MSKAGGRDRCGHHPAMNPNEVQLSALTPGSLFSNPPLLSHLSLPSSFCPSVSLPSTPPLSGSLSLLLPRCGLLIHTPPPPRKNLLSLPLCLSPPPFCVPHCHSSILSSSIFPYLGLKHEIICSTITFFTIHLSPVPLSLLHLL